MTSVRIGVAAIALLTLAACASQEGAGPLTASREEPGYSDRYGTPLSGGTPTIPRSGCDADCAPDFEVTTLEGTRFDLSTHAGKVVVLNFWESW